MTARRWAGRSCWARSSMTRRARCGGATGSSAARGRGAGARAIVVAVDPPVTATAASDACGIVVAGFGPDGRAYVVADRTLQGREPQVWARRGDRLLPRCRSAAEPARRGGLVRGVRRRVPRTRGAAIDALADGALVPALGRGVGRRPLRRIAVLSRGGDPAAGHVGFLFGETDAHVVLLGGNQGDAVGVAAFPKSAAARLALAAGETGGATGTGRPVAKDAIRYSRARSSTSSKWKADYRRSARPRRPDQPRHHARQSSPRGRASRLDRRFVARRSRRELRRIAPATVRDIYSRATGRPRTAPSSPARSPSSTSMRRSITASPAPCGCCSAPSGTDPDGEIGPDTRAAIAALSGRRGAAALRRGAPCPLSRAAPLLALRPRVAGARRHDARARQRAIAADTTRTTLPTSRKDRATMTETTSGHAAERPKWWGQSITIWGTVITGLSTVLPALGPAFGIDITGRSGARSGRGDRADRASGRRSRRHHHDDLRTRARHEAARAAQHATEAVSRARAFMTSSGAQLKSAAMSMSFPPHAPNHFLAHCHRRLPAARRRDRCLHRRLVGSRRRSCISKADHRRGAVAHRRDRDSGRHRQDDAVRGERRASSIGSSCATRRRQAHQPHRRRARALRPLTMFATRVRNAARMS